MALACRWRREESGARGRASCVPNNAMSVNPSAPARIESSASNRTSSSRYAHLSGLPMVRHVFEIIEKSRRLEICRRKPRQRVHRPAPLPNQRIQDRFSTSAPCHVLLRPIALRIKARTLVDEPLYGVRNRFSGVMLEVVVLPTDRTQAADLPKQPFQGGDTPTCVRRQELSRSCRRDTPGWRRIRKLGSAARRRLGARSRIAGIRLFGEILKNSAA